MADINPLGNRTTTIYNIASQVTANENALGNRTSYIYDADGQTQMEISALGFRTTTVYDDTGQRVALVDARANRHTFAYDAVGQETQRIDPLGRRTTFGYDAAGQQNLRIDARGNCTTYSYSENGQLTSRKYPDGTRATFAYDAKGDRTLMANATGRYSYSFDGNGQSTVAANPDNMTITYAYDPVGNRSIMDAPDTGRFTYVYDATNQISLLHNAFNERTSFAYDNAGRRTVKNLANGTRASFTYDAASNLTNLHNLKSNNSIISSFDYRYNKVNDRMAVGETNGNRVTWTYDDTSQLTSEHRSGANSFHNTFVYDPVGNRLVLNEHGTRTTTSYDPANQIKHSVAATGRTTYTFDADGNQQVIQEPSGNRTTNMWDYENRLTSVEMPNSTRATNTYNPDNLRVTAGKGDATKTWLWDKQNYLSQTEGGVLIFTNTPDYYGDLVSQRQSTTSNWYHFDARGDTKELTDSSETITDARLYDAWGKVISTFGSTPIPFEFTGRMGCVSDASINLNCIRARWYGALIGRWLSCDPSTYILQYDRYSYVKNDPTNFVDPSGETRRPTSTSKRTFDCQCACVTASPFGGSAMKEINEIQVEAPTESAAIVECANRCSAMSYVNAGAAKECRGWLDLTPQIFLCQRDIIATNKSERCVNDCGGQHVYIQFGGVDGLGKPLPGTSGCGFSGGTVIPNVTLPSEEKAFCPSHCEGFLPPPGMSVEEAEKCIRNTPIEDHYHWIQYNCKKWAVDTIQKCGMVPADTIKPNR